ncbi:MAG: hypothetical protein ABW005_07600 [Burkholderiaceae bacterium]
MNRLGHDVSSGMWRVVFYERKGNRVQMDRTGPWLPEKKLALLWAQWFGERGYHVALQDQFGSLEKLSSGLPS